MHPLNINKRLKRLAIFVAILVGLVIGIAIVVNYYLKDLGITYDSFNYSFPNELTVNNLRMDNEDILLTSDYTYVSIRLKKLWNGELSSRFLEVKNMWVELRPGNPNDTSIFELSDLIPIQCDEVVGTNIHYQDKEGLDSTIVDLPTLYAINFVLDNGIFTDSIASKNGTLVISFPDTTESTDTTAVMADLIHINANSLVLDNAHIQFNYPNESYDAKHIDLSLNGFGNDNPIDLKLNKLSLLYQDSIELSSNGKELSITQNGDLALQEFGFQTPLFDVNVVNAGATAQSMYYADIKKSHINSNTVRMFVDDFPVKENIDMLFDGGIAYQNDSIIFDHFEVVLDKKTKVVLNGYAIYSDTLEKTNMDILTFQSTLFELQRVFMLDELEGQKDVKISSQFLVTGNLSSLKVNGNTTLNKNTLGIKATYAEKPNNGMNINMEVSSKTLNPHQIISSVPEGLKLINLHFTAKTLLDSSHNIEQLLVNFKCAELGYSDYKLTQFKADAKMRNGITQLKVKANEQNFALEMETKQDILNTDSVYFTGLLDMDIPQFAHLENTAGNLHTPISGYFKNTYDNLAFGMSLDSLLFVSDSLDKDYMTKISFYYKSDTAYGTFIDVTIDEGNSLNFKGDPETFDWLSAAEIDTSNYPYFEAQLLLNLDSTLFKVLVGNPGSVEITNLKVETTENSVAFSMQSPLVVYEDYRIENTQVSFFTNFSAYHGEISIDSLQNPYQDVNTIKSKVASIAPYRTECELFFVLSDFKESIDLGIEFIDSANTKILKLEEGRPVKLGQNNWLVTENEGVTFDDNWKLQSSHFKVTNDSQKVEVSTRQDVIDIIVSQLQIKPIYTILTDDSIVSGLCNFQSEYQIEQEKLTWNGSIDRLKVDTIPIGKFTNEGVVTAEYFQTHGEFVHQKSELFLDVEKDLDKPLQYKIELKHFDLTSLNSIYEQWGFNGNIDGTLNGNLVGEIAEYFTAKGFIHFDQVHAKLDDYGLYLAIPNSIVDIKKDELLFHDFTFKDRDGMSLLLHGNLSLVDDHEVDLSLKTEQFKILEQKDKSKKVWGNMDISSNLRLTGSFENLAISGFFNTLKSTNIGYRYHSEVSVNKMEEDIEFTSFSDSSDFADEVKILKKESQIKWNVKVNMGKTKLYVLLSEVSNDYVRMIASGNINLKTGRGIIPRAFGKIESNNGSIFYDVPMVSNLDLKINYAAIKFEGDVERPKISFRGTEIFRVSTNEISGQSSKTGKMVPVEVVAIVNESSIDEFEIKFDLKSADGEMGSYIDGLPASTRETYAMNLLIFGTMKQTDQNGNATMKAVVSKLNELSRRNIKSADLAFYVDTEENVNVDNLEGVNSIGYDFSKDFFDDKVKVTVGGEVVLETYAADGRKQFNPFGNVEIDYRIKEDPDIVVFASKRDSYLGPVDGQVDKYSVGISFSRWFKNLFHKTKPSKNNE